MPASSTGNTGSCSSSCAPGGVSGGSLIPRCGCVVENEGEQLLFAICWRVFCDGTWRFWSLEILGCLRCRAPSAPDRECDALVIALPPLPLSSGRMLKPRAEVSFAEKWPKLPGGGDVHPKEQPHLHTSCSGRKLQGTVLPTGEGTGTRWGQEQGEVATICSSCKMTPRGSSGAAVLTGHKGKQLTKCCHKRHDVNSCASKFLIFSGLAAVRAGVQLCCRKHLLWDLPLLLPQHR